jgi:squalene synthase HpnC
MEGSQIAAGPPTRDHGSENFPVASLLLPAAMRGKVLAFYRFVRTADDIADSPDLTASDKLRRLDALEATADAALAEVGTAEARAMLSAFRQDVSQRRYADWAELEAYCARSAGPVGRMLLRVHGESEEAHRASDALCTALQVLNHLQDLVPDRDALDRVYLPTPWMDLAGGEAAFFAPGNTQRRAVLDAALDRVEASLEMAAPLPRLLRTRLRHQAAVTLALAWKLMARLRDADPVLRRVALSRSDFAAAFTRLALPAPSDAAVVRHRVARARSSFARC